MYLIIIAWIYVVLMMSVAEATNSNGTMLGAVVTFFLYGVGPAGLLAYLMSTPARKRARKKREAEALAAYQAAMPSAEPDAGSHAAGGGEPPTGTDTTDAADAVAGSPGITPVRKEP